MMKIFYVISVWYLLIAFLGYKKKDKKISFISSVVYAMGLFFCYNVVVSYFISLFNVGGSLLSFALSNYVVGTFLLGSSLKKREYQKYYWDKKEIIIFFSVLVIVFLLGFYRMRGFEAISYESGDSAIHYRHALCFSEELALLNKNNSQDIVFGSFDKAMAISYVNGGLFLKVLSNFNSYKTFMVYDVLCLVLCSLMFLATLFKLEGTKKNYLYLLAGTLGYVLAFPLNSFLFGFCYLGLCVMVVNLLFLTIMNWENNFSDNFILKLVSLFLINMGIFFGYYLFVPAIYLALGLMFIYLFKKKKISSKQLFIYGGVTLVVPFIIGCLYFVLPLFMDSNEDNVFSLVSLYGYSYNNVTPIYLFIILTSYLIFDYFYNKNKKRGLDFLHLNLYVMSGYILIFFILYLFNYAELYYFYKLFFVYWLFFILLLVGKLAKKQKIMYGLVGLIVISSLYVLVGPGNGFSSFLVKSNIYNWNAEAFREERILFTKSEVELMEATTKYKDICEPQGKFLVLGNDQKYTWFYAVTNLIPVADVIDGDVTNLYKDIARITFRYWDSLKDYDCLLYYYNDMIDNYNADNYQVLYENNEGVLLKKIEKDETR